VNSKLAISAYAKPKFWAADNVCRSLALLLTCR